MGNVVKDSRRIVASSGGSGGGGGGTVTSVNSGTDITVDNTDPANPIVNFTGTYQDPITVVANYSALPAVGTVTGDFYWCSASQGTKWLPGALGGTYYSAGMYYSNGVTWEFLDVPYNATQAEVNTGTNTDKFVTPATLAAATTVIPKTGTTGDIISFSATDTPSRIADVAVGSYLRSGGVATLPLWSTLKLPNSATANYIPYATSSNTWGESANLQFNGSKLGINMVPSNVLDVSTSANSAQTMQITNSTSGTAAQARIIAANSVGDVSQFGIFSSASTAVGAIAARYSYFYGSNSLVLWGGNNLIFANGGSAAASGNFNSSGRLYLGGSTSAAAILHLAAGTATASTAPLKFTSGTNLTTAEAGAMEYNGTNLFFTRTGTTRQTVLTANVVTTEVVVSDTTITVNINGTDYKLLARA